MLLTILGWFWIITGVLFVLRPERFRNKMKKKSVKKLKKIFFWLVLVLGLLLIKATWGIPGVLAKVFMIFGFIGILKAFFFLKAKTADSLIEWYINQPIRFFRMCAIGQIVFGALLLSV